MVPKDNFVHEKSLTLSHWGRKYKVYFRVSCRNNWKTLFLEKVIPKTIYKKNKDQNKNKATYSLKVSKYRPKKMSPGKHFLLKWTKCKIAKFWVEKKTKQTKKRF